VLINKFLQELLKNGFHWVEKTREESELNRPDFLRFERPYRYQTEEELNYFHSEQNKELFKKMYLS
jgi:hypothetical protein